MRKRYAYLGAVFLLLTATLLGTLSGQAASVTLSVGSVEAAPGAEAEVPIALKGASGIGAMHLELTYDAAVLEAQSVDKGPLLGEDALLDFNASEPGVLVVGLITLDALEGDGTALTARFAVKDDEGQSSPLRLENARAWDGKTRLDIPVTVEEGEFTVSPAASSLLSPLMFVVLVASLLLLLALFVLLRRRRPQPAPAQGRPTELPSSPSAFCPYCGAPREPGGQFCVSCGRRMPTP